MKKKTCINCRFAEFDKTKSGRRNLDHGECNFEVILPRSFSDLRGDPPTKRSISKYTKPDCPCWENIKKTPEPSCSELN